ncbi:phosphotransferase family protein [Sporichthya brevicatena]|uniref:Phosphotransferase family protein n=1 Tax=Sporichthya brevicatena TaxID=171442 RepID=A0ABN1GW56_9ACTN
MSLAPPRDPVQTAKALRGWLATKLLGVTDLAVSEVAVPAGHAMATEMIRFRADWVRNETAGGAYYVAKVAPVGPGVFPHYDLVTEQWVMQALSVHSAAPVPPAPWVETDPSVLGASFLVMERLLGRVPRDDPPYTAGGWVLDLTADERARLYDNGLIALSQLHAADAHSLGLDFLDRPELGATPLDQQLALWRASYDWAAAEGAHPVVEAAFDWLEANRPGDEPTVVCWGGARLGNLLFADDLTVAGVLDWKLVALASPELDLGWWLFVQRHHTDGLGRPLPTGFPDRAATIARYAELTGHQVRHAEYYEVLAALRLAVLLHRTTKLLAERGDRRPVAADPASRLLAELIGAPVPDADTRWAVPRTVSR